MAQKFEFKKGFLKLQRLGPIKFGEQSRWSIRAPESTGMWAFPAPHFDLFYAYHRYVDLAPKEFRERYPKNLKWYLSESTDEPVDNIVLLDDEESLFAGRKNIFYRDEAGELQPAYLSGEFYAAKDAWVETVGKKILPVRTFWYRGDLYTHFNNDGTIGAWSMSSKDPNNDWTLMSTEKLAKIMKKPGSIFDFEGSYDGRGIARTFNYSKDHLEVFIPRGRGIIKDKI